MDLVNLIEKWICDNAQGWRILRISGDHKDKTTGEILCGEVVHKGLGYPGVYIYDTFIKFLEDDLTIEAHNEQFLPLLSNRLYIMKAGFDKALASREQKNHDTI